MYIKKLKFENYGPIDKFEIHPRFNEDGSPMPIILMGKNGSGKTLILAQILQALLNNKSEEYNNIPEKKKTQLYKVISTSYIKSNKQDGMMSINFDDNNFNYTEVLSKQPQNTINNNRFPDFTSKLQKDEKFKKNGMYETKNGKLNYDDYVCLYFPVDRYYIPGWKNKEIKSNLKLEEKYLGKNSRNIICNTIQNDFESYILNTLIDKELYDHKQFLKINGNSFVLDKNGNPQVIYTGKNSSILEFINNILSEFKGNEYVRKRLYVSQKENRKIGIIGVKSDGSEDEIIDSFNKLSTGEYSLLSLFVAILMDYDKTTNSRGFNFQDIKGVVLVDEAELNLHIDLQMNVLPKLMKKFKNIQFIITTQSPFLIYGINDIYKSNCDIYDMPSGTLIDNVIDLSEVKESYDAIINHNEELSKRIKETTNDVITSTNDLIVITEGKTDPIYLNKALGKLNKYKDKRIKIIGLKTAEANKYQDEGWAALNKLGEALTVVSPTTPIVLVYDRDVIIDELLKNEFLRYSHNVYKMSIPVPSHREDSKDLCIEHYFKDTEIKRVDTCGRRLYIGNEFNTNGISFKGNLMCKSLEKCGTNSLKIIDGSGKSQVYDQKDESRKNLALSKNQFAEYIKNDTENFNNFNFKEFNKIFDVFDKIIIDANNKNN